MKLKKVIKSGKLDVIAKLRKWDGVYTGEHFVYTSEKHGEAYLNFDVAFPHVLFVLRVVWRLIRPYRGRYDVIVAPAVGGVALVYAAGILSLFTGRKVSVVWAEKVKDENSPGGKRFIFERQGFAEKVKGKRVLVLDDVMTNANEGGSVYQLCRLVEAHGGKVIGVSVVCNRCAGTAKMLKVPDLIQLAEVDAKLFWAVEAEDCRLCKENQPIVTDIGHSDKFREKHPEYKEYKTLLTA